MSAAEKAFKIIFKGDAMQVHDLIRCLDDLVKSSAYQSHNQDLVHLYPKFLDRVFGEDVANGGLDKTAASSAYGAWSKGILGGWLRTFIQQNLANSSNSDQSLTDFTSLVRQRSTNAPSAAVPVGVKLIQQLFAFSHFMGMVDAVNVSYEWNVNFLPHKLSALLTNRAAFAVIDSIPAQVLARELQTTFRTVDDKNSAMPKQTVVLSSFQYLLFCLVRYATLSSQYMVKPIASSSGGSSTGIVGGSSTGSYLTTTEQLWQGKGCAAWLQSTPYLALVQQYIDDLLLSDEDSKKHAIGRHFFFLLAIESWIDLEVVLRHDVAQAAQCQKILAGDASQNLLPLTNTTAQVQPAFQQQPSQMPHMSLSANPLRRNLLSVGETQQALRPSVSHPTRPVILSASGGTVNSSGGVSRWTQGSLQCTYLLIHAILAHLVPSSHASASSVASTAAAGLQSAGSSHQSPVLGGINAHAVVRFQQHAHASYAHLLRRHCDSIDLSLRGVLLSSGGGGGRLGGHSHRASQQLLQQLLAGSLDLRRSFDQLLLLQIPVYDMLTVLFAGHVPHMGHSNPSYGGLVGHVGSSSANSFYGSERELLGLSVEIYLLWLQPWKTCPGFLPESGPERTAALRLYIAHNLHFYTTLFVLALQTLTTKITQLSSVTAGSEAQRLLMLLGRLLEAYSSEVQEAVTSLTQGFAHWLDHSVVTSSSSTSSSYASSVRTPAQGSRARSASSLGLVDVSNEELKLMKHLHAHLYPDEKIWTQLSDHGNTDFRVHALEAAKSVFFHPSFSTRSSSSFSPSGDNHDHAGDFVQMLFNGVQSYVYDLFGLDNNDNSNSGSSFDLFAAGRSYGGSLAAGSFVGHQASSTSSISTSAGSDRRSSASSSAATATAAVGTVLQIRQRLVQLFPDLACAPHPSSAAATNATSTSGGGVSSGGHTNAAEALETIFDPLSGKLTKIGRQQVAQGTVKLRVRDLLQVSSASQNATTSATSSSSAVSPANAAMASSTLLTSVDDPLDLPLCAHECPPIAFLCITLSRYLNRLCHLPRSRRYLRVSFATYLRHHLLGALLRRSSSASTRAPVYASAVEGQTNVDADRDEPETSLSFLQVWQSSFRFNLRVLATYRVFSFLVLVVLYLLFAAHQQQPATITAVHGMNKQQLPLRVHNIEDITATLTSSPAAGASIGYWPFSLSMTLTLLALPFAYLAYRGSFPEYVIA